MQILDKIKMHIFNIDSQKRENEAIDRLFTKSTINMWLSKNYNINSFGIIQCIRMPFNYIIPKTKLDGDIDICFIPIVETVFRSDKDFINPDLSKIIAVEVKTMLFDLNEKFHSPKFRNDKSNKLDRKQLKARNQALKLCHLGFNDVCLLYLLFTEPIEPQHGNIRDWFNSIDFASHALSNYQSFIIFKSDDIFATSSLNIGSMLLKPENMAAGIVYNMFFQPPVDSSLNIDATFRNEFKHQISKLFPFEVHNAKLPLIVRACSNMKCRNLYVYCIHNDHNCPKCNSQPL